MQARSKRRQMRKMCCCHCWQRQQCRPQRAWRPRSQLQRIPRPGAARSVEHRISAHTAGPVRAGTGLRGRNLTHQTCSAAHSLGHVPSSSVRCAPGGAPPCRNALPPAGVLTTSRSSIMRPITANHLHRLFRPVLCCPAASGLPAGCCPVTFHLAVRHAEPVGAARVSKALQTVRAGVHISTGPR